MESKRWTLSVIGFSLVVLLLLGLIAFIIDPHMQYRITEDKYLLYPSFVIPGIIKNHNYDTVVLGSSMAQNFNMNSFREKLHLNPIKVTIGGISLSEIKEMAELALHQNKFDGLYICLDLALFAGRNRERSFFPEYLTDYNILNDYKYLLGYETLMRVIPVNIALTALFQAGVELPEKYADRVNVNIDKLGDWHKEHLFGKDIVVKNYKSSAYSTSTPDTDGLYERMTAEIDGFLESYIFQSDKKYVFFFPPYSALYWYTTQKDNYFDIYMDVKKYIVNKSSDKNNVEIFDFQSMAEICDLDNYKDTTHYSADINELMVDCFKSGEYKVNNETIYNSIYNLELLVEQFKIENADWFL